MAAEAVNNKHSSMRVEVNQQPITALDAYGSIPIAFEVNAVLDVATTNGEFVLTERKLDRPYVKDYDAIDGEQPHQWASRFDVSNWGVFMAFVEGKPVGGTVVARNTPGLMILEGRDDLAVLWDIRVSPRARGQGVGAALFREAETWAKAKGCRQIKVETQNINVAACRFYARQGCVLRVVNRYAYPTLPDETQLLWYKDLVTVNDI